MTASIADAARPPGHLPDAAFVGPLLGWTRDAASPYLTIEYYKGAIPLGAAATDPGNRVFGCDDCQIVCPWNPSPAPPGSGRLSSRATAWTAPNSAELFLWKQEEFLGRTEGFAAAPADFTNARLRQLGGGAW
ncbi:hypothetical protein ACHWUR_29345 [Klebsiella pneumoniae]